MRPAVPLSQAVGLAALAGRGLLVQNLLLRALQGVLPLLGLVAMQWLLDAVARGLGPDGAALDAARRDVVVAIALAAGIALVGAWLGALAGIVGERHARRCADRCVALLHRHAAALDLGQLESPAIADQLHRAGAEASQRPARVVQNLAAFGLAATTLLLMAAATGTVAWWLPLVVGLSAAPQVVARLRASQRQFSWQQDHTEAQRHAGYLAGLLVGRAYAKDLRLLDLAEPVAARVETERARLTDEQLALQRRRVLGETMAQAVGTVAMFLAYLYLADVALRGGLSLGGLLLQVQAVQRTQNGVRDCLLAYGALRDDRLFLQHVFAFLGTQPTLRAPAAPVTVPPGPLAISLRGVHFAYPGSDRPALAGIDLDVGAGQRLAILGPNGAGKSTLVRLLCGLAAPARGTVALGGVDLATAEPKALRPRLAVFFQDAVGFELSARDNLAFGAAAARDPELLAAADLVGIGELLRGWPEGLGTRLGRGFAGSRELSAGQWRRLLLARALARPADLLVLDEPFAFLDADACTRLERHLRDPARRGTVVIVDHRADRLGWVDHVAALDQGRLVAHGPPTAPSH